MVKGVPKTPEVILVSAVHLKDLFKGTSTNPVTFSPKLYSNGFVGSVALMNIFLSFWILMLTFLSVKLLVELLIEESKVKLTKLSSAHVKVNDWILSPQRPEDLASIGMLTCPIAVLFTPWV